MKLEILSFNEALKFKPEIKTHPIRITSSLDSFSWMSDLVKDNNWTRDSRKSWYYFDDLWSKSYKEYSWYDTNGEEFEKYFLSEKKKYPLITKESLLEYFETRGHPYGRYTLFSPDLARKIYTEFEEYKEEVEQVMVHCQFGANRSPAIGMAMNETYDWGIKELKEKFPAYRRFVYEIMKEVGEEFV